MYVPAAFSVTDPEQLHEFIRSHSFAILVSPGESSDSPPIASHLPLLLHVGRSAHAREQGLEGRISVMTEGEPMVF